MQTKLIMEHLQLTVGAVGKMRRFLQVAGIALCLLRVNTSSLAVGTWVPLVNQPPVGIAMALLLPDGRVLAGDGETAWYSLTPDIYGSYVNGTWSALSSMHDSRYAFSSQVLTNGQVFVAGGEVTGRAGGLYSAEVYDPLLDNWTMCPGAGCAFSDSGSEILQDGNVLITPVGPTNGGGTMIFAPSSNAWIAGPQLYRGYYEDEASWVKLSDNSILVIDSIGSGGTGTNSERYIPALNQWINDANVPVDLWGGIFEMGAALLLPNGNAFFLGASGGTAIYTPTGSTNMGTWFAGPVIPNGQATVDSPAAMMVNGKILCMVSPYPTSGPPSTFYEYDSVSNAFTLTGYPGNTMWETQPCHMLDLPDGTVLFTSPGTQFYIYQPDGTALAEGRPTIISITTNYYRSYHLTGTLLNGITEGAGYGDDAQMNSNYPLVRMTNSVTGLVYYARTYNWSSTGVMTGTNVVSTEFMVPENLPAGSYSLVVAANGNSSSPVTFTFNPDPLSITLPTGFFSSGPIGGPFNQQEQAYFLNNNGASPLNWTLVNTSLWLNVSSAGGSLVPGGQTGVIVSVSSTATNLPVGIYLATIWFTNLSTGAAQSIPFKLEINPLLQNGGFEFGSIADWVLSGNQGNSGVVGNYNGIGGIADSAHSGHFSALLGLNNSVGYFSQTVPTVPEQSYVLSLFLNSQYTLGGSNALTISWDGITLFEQQDCATVGWSNLEFIVWAATDSTVLEFSFENATNYFGLDDISLSNLPPTLSIVSQPVSQVIPAGGSATLSVLVGGPPPFTYQWQNNGTNVVDDGQISGSKTANLSVTNAVAADSGSYTVVISSGSQMATSAVANLTVFECAVSAPPGLISWWPGNGTANDIAGTNNGTLQNGATYAPGEVGYSFSFNGVNQCVSIPDSPSWDFGTNAFTLELWANFSSIGGSPAMLANDEGGGPTHKWIFWLNGSTLQLFLDEITNSYAISSAVFLPNLNQWYHIALTRSGDAFTFYVDGSLYSVATSSVVMPSPNAPLTIGDAEGGFCVDGLLDDIRIYDVALSSSEIQAIYKAGNNGMCAPSSTPSLSSVPSFVVGAQPISQTLPVGDTVSFSTFAECSAAFSYQWRKNGQSIPGANDASYSFGPIQLSDAGGYDVVISNQFGWASSSVANLSIIPNFNTNCAVSAPSGMIAWWAGEFNANDIVGTNNGAFENGSSYAPGEVGFAFSFNGVNQFILVPDSPSWSFGTNAFTLELWANFSSINGDPAMLANDEGGGPTHKWIFWLSGSSLQLFLDEITNIYAISSAAFTPTLGQWYHIVLTRNGTSFIFYVNGSLYSSTTSSVVMPAPIAPLTIGNAEGGAYFDGLLDDVRIYNRALAASEIQAIYQAGTNGMCPPTPIVFAGSPTYSKTNGVILNANLRSGQSYSLQGNTNLASTNWIALTNFTAGSAPVISLTNNAATNIPQQFYRIISP